MVFANTDINYLAVLGAAIISMVIGAIWYSPALFGKQWIKLMGFTKKDIDKAKKRGMEKYYFWNFIALLVTAYVLANFVGVAQAASFVSGAMVGFWVWLGFIATMMLASVLWEGKPFKLYAITVIHYLISLVVMGGILAVWV